jgi:Xaa-Pro aminopeptidase
MSKKSLKIPSTRLIIADSENDANLYWATRFLAPDPVIFLEHRKKRYLILNDLELDRGRKEADVDKVFSYSELEKKVGLTKGQRPRVMDVVRFLLDRWNAKAVTVPFNFPIIYGEELKKRRIRTVIHGDPFYEARLIKTSQEKAAIKKTLAHVSKAIQAAYQVLRESKIRGKRIFWRGKVLTSETLREVINLSLMKNNCLGKHTIVACGLQGVDPHCAGYGPLKPHEPIIMDVFPKSMDSQYYGDMTRTVVKGKASPGFRKQWRAVKTAQEAGIRMVKAGVDGKKIHDWILDSFERQGFKTGLKNGRMQGFFHGTGHGLGIEIHEAPRVSRVSQILKSGNVVTIEPGLYYTATGGVRIEDVVYVKKGGYELLSHCPKIMEIP